MAANLPSGRGVELPDDEVGWLVSSLPQPIASDLAVLALEALDAVLPEGGWWWSSWVDDRDRLEIRSVLDEVRSVLGAHGSSADT